MRAQFLGLAKRIGSNNQPVLRLVFENTGATSSRHPYTEISLSTASDILNGKTDRGRDTDRGRAGRQAMAKRGIDMRLLEEAHKDAAYFKVRAKIDPSKLEALPYFQDIAPKEPILPQKLRRPKTGSIDFLTLGRAQPNTEKSYKDYGVPFL